MNREWLYIVGLAIGALILKFLLQLVGGRMSASIGFEETKHEGQSIWSSRLGYGKAILITNKITITPDVDGDYIVDWAFENVFDGKLTARRDYPGIIVPNLKAGVITDVILPDEAGMAYRPEYYPYTYFVDADLKASGLVNGMTYTCKHKVWAVVRSPSGDVFNVTPDPTYPAIWQDSMKYVMLLLSAELGFAEQIVR